MNWPNNCNGYHDPFVDSLFDNGLAEPADDITPIHNFGADEPRHNRRAEFRPLSFEDNQR